MLAIEKILHDLKLARFKHVRAGGGGGFTQPTSKAYTNVSNVTFSSAPFVRGAFVDQCKAVSFHLTLICTDKVDKKLLNKLQQHGVKPRSIHRIRNE